MLPDRDLQLLTAYVDGEISVRQREQLARLLQKSATARNLLQSLQGDVRRVRELTRLKLGPDFPAKVVQTLGQGSILPRPVRRPPPAPAPWKGMMVAASVFAMITAASYWYFAPRPEGVRPVPSASAAKPSEGVLGRFSERALRIAAADLATDKTRKALVTKLQQDRAYQVDLAVQHNGRAVQRLVTTLKQSGIRVVISAAVQDSLNQRKSQNSYCLFADNVKPDELAGLLQQLGIHSMNQKDAGVNRVIVDVMTSEHREKLNAVFGPAEKDPRQVSLGASDPLGDLVNKRIVAGNAAGQGASAIKPKASPPPERLALVLAWPHGNLTGLGHSLELQPFLSRPRPQLPGTLQVLLVVHEART